ncbi:DinB family protein [Cohnella cholangitidis]|uniref:DinB family protein n=1 Tax=Cohnella cholangitidis TaxID=2598458 RepID=A0A7G5BY58_9BACL|nr:DinB family protein [Cohnella cholangitidis]QMV41892.1 DinB family protein [Cohnella cholangitidis]
MNTQASLSALEETVSYYLEQLQRIGEEQLSLRPSEEEWSLGQLYNHLIGATQYMSLRNIGLCREGDKETIVVGGAKSEAGEAVFRNGGFPDAKISVPPSPQYTPRQPNGKEELSEGLLGIVRQMRDIEPTLREISPENAANHPRLGALTAKEWFQLVEMHFRHHLKQLHRLQQFAGIGAS